MDTCTRHISYLASLLGTLALLTGCANPGEDVRVTLCKDLAADLLDPPHAITWKETRNVMRRGESLAVNLSFDAPDRDGKTRSLEATCIYRYNAVDDTAAILADPLSAYATSPERLILNGRTIGNPLLAEAVGRAMLKQGRAFLERAQHGLNEAARQIRERLPDAPER